MLSNEKKKRSTRQEKYRLGPKPTKCDHLLIVEWMRLHHPFIYTQDLIISKNHLLDKKSLISMLLASVLPDLVLLYDKLKYARASWASSYFSRMVGQHKPSSSSSPPLSFVSRGVQGTGLLECESAQAIVHTNGCLGWLVCNDSRLSPDNLLQMEWTSYKNIEKKNSVYSDGLAYVRVTTVISLLILLQHWF